MIASMQRWVASYLRRFWTEWHRSEKMDWQAFLVCLVGGLLLWPLVHRLPAVGWDWYYWFHPGIIDFYPPWTRWVIAPLVALPWRLGFSLLNSLTLVAVAVAAHQADRRGRLSSRLSAAALALLTPPVFMALWLGNIEGLVLMGMVAFPPGVILALMKPHLTGWAILARRQYLAWAAGLGLVSLVIWGWWPPRMLAELGRLAENGLMIGWHNMGWPILCLGLLLVVFSGADPLRLMSAGFLLTPYLMPNHYLLLTPVLGRVLGWRRLILWIAAWISALAAGADLGPGRYLVYLFPIFAWWWLGKSPVPEQAPSSQPGFWRAGLNRLAGTLWRSSP